jgi:hypothetical protein
MQIGTGRCAAGRAALALPMALAGLLVAGTLPGCAGRKVPHGSPRPANAEVVLIARGSLRGVLVPTG